MASRRHARPFVPALSFDVLTPLYDPLLRLLGVDAVRRRFVEQTGIKPGMRVLDLGCGTGSLVLLAKRVQPTADVVGLDVDPKILAIARRKVAADGVDVDFHLGRIEDAGFAPASFDRVVTTLVLHHLTTEEKLSALSAANRLLRPGGELHVADLGPPQNKALRAVVAASTRRFGSGRVAANMHGRLPALMGEAGFVSVAETERVWTLFGRVVFWRAMAASVSPETS